LTPLKDLGINLLKHDISKPINENMNYKFDVVFAFDVLEYVEALEAAIENIGKLLKPNGLLIATLRWKENMADNYGICPFVIMYSTGGVTSIPFTSWATSLRCLKKNSISLNLTLYFWELKENLWRF
jgi:SAM-dependent methyltransferase